MLKRCVKNQDLFFMPSNPQENIFIHLAQRFFINLMIKIQVKMQHNTQYKMANSFRVAGKGPFTKI